MTTSYVPYSEYKDSGVEWVGSIPKDWFVSKLGYLISTIVPMRDKPTSLSGEVPWVRIEDFDGKYIADSKSGQGVSKTIIKDMHLKVFPVGAVLCSCSCTMGRTAIVTKPLISNQTFIGLVPQASLDSEYLYYLMQASEGELTSKSAGAIQTYLSQDEFKAMRFGFPSVNEQSQIANFLDHETAKIDTLIEKQQQLIKLLKEKRQAVISHAVTKGLNPDVPMKDSGVEWLGEVPTHWDVLRIKNLASIISKGTTPSTIGGDFVDDGVRFLKGENIGKSIAVQSMPKFFITEAVDEKISRSRLKENDVLVIIAGATTGLASILQKDLLPANTNQAVSFIRPKERRYAKLIVRWLSTEFAQRIIWMGAVQAAQPNLSMEDLGNIPIVVPPVDELTAVIENIDKRLVKFDELNLKAAKAIEIMQERRTALISAAVTGKIDVRNWQAPQQTNKEDAA